MRKFELVILLLFALPAVTYAQDEEKKNENGQVKQVPKEEPRINLKGLISQSMSFLVIEHAIRMGDPQTRNELRGPFFSDWFNSVASIKGWDDGDGFVPNWVGHPMQGSVSAFIFANNHKPSQNIKFGLNKEYWRAKRAQFIYAVIYSVMFEIGPLSESSLGNLGFKQGKNTYIDHVVTPIAGILWSIGEDAMYQYLILPVSRWNPKVGNVVLVILNLTRSTANALSFQYPWRGTLPR